MLQDLSSSDSPQERDTPHFSASAGNRLCREVMSILEEASSIDAVVPSLKLLSAVQRFAYLNGYLVNWHDGGQLMRVLPDRPLSSIIEEALSPK